VSSRHRYENLSDDDELPVPIEDRSRRRSASKPAKKQIIPLSDNSLIADVAKAKWAYTPEEIFDDDDYNDYGCEDEDEGYSPWHNRESFARRRKTSLMYPEYVKEQIYKDANVSSSWFSWIPFFGRKRQNVNEITKKSEELKQTQKDKQPKEVVGINIYVTM
jgi:hypothetical protein